RHPRRRRGAGTPRARRWRTSHLPAAGRSPLGTGRAAARQLGTAAAVLFSGETRYVDGVVRIRLLLALLASLLSLFVCELLTRALGHYDVDGSFCFSRFRVRPYHLPVEQTRQTVARWASRPGTLLYDPELGWAPRPGAVSDDGFYRYDAAGVRV